MLLVSSSWWEQEGDMLIIIMCGVCVVVCLPVVALFLLLNPESRNHAWGSHKFIILGPPGTFL